MAVRFVIGRAGSGKTHHCLEAVRAGLRADPVEGPRLILLVPEQAALQTERALLDPPDSKTDDHGCRTITAAHRAEVLSFRRLAFRVLEEVGAPLRPALTESARAMVLRHLIARHADELRYYGRSARPSRGGGRLSGFVERLGLTVSELLEEAVEPRELSALAEGAANSHERPALDPAQAAKWHDLALIYQAYVDFLGTRLLDPSQALQIAREQLHQCRWLSGAEVWVDGFASFSGQERLTLLRVAQMASRTEIALLLDPNQLHEEKGVRPDAVIARLFSKTLRTYRDLLVGLSEAGLTVDEPVLLRPEPLPRFRGSPPLAKLEATLFVPSRGAEMTAAGDAASAIDIVQLPNRRIEADFAVSRVLRWVQDSRAGYRLSDVAIIVRDIDLYHDLLSEALDSRGVPFFIDRRRPVIHHPLVELIRAAFAMATNDWTIESVCAALRTGLVPITMDDADLLENYLIAHGIEGVQRWGASDWSFRSRSRFIASTESPTKDEAVALDRINALRKDILALFESWMRIAASPGAPTGSAWAAAIRSLIQHMDVPGSLRRWSNNAERDGELERAEEHRQVWGDVMSLVDDMGFALSETAMSATEVAEVIDAGLSQLTLALAPPTIDQLLVGSIERSRHPRIKAAVIVGFNDEVFPKRPAEDSVLNDDDRSALLDAGVRIGLPAKSRFIDECMLCYIALTRASQRVVVTYASADETGAALRPSSYLPAVLQACPGLQPRIVGDPVRTRDTWDIWSHRDLVERLSAEFRTRPAPAKDDRAVRARWNTLYDFRRRAVGDDSATARGLASLDPRLDARVSSAMIERMFAGSLRTSVSQLESYATCPFQFFARHGLRLKERERAQLEPVDIGLVHHAVLEDFVRGMADASRGWEALSEDQLIHELSGSCRRVERRLPEDASSSQARNAYVLRRSAEQLARVIRAQQDVGRRGRTRPRIAELPFGFATTRSWPALELETPQGRRVRVRGYIDRVDLAELSDELLGVVIDYKRTRDKRLELSRVYHGLSLQLIAYLLVLQEHGRTLAGRPIRPIGALFVSLMPQYQVVDHPSALDDDPGRERRAHPPRGLISVEDVAALESSSPDGLSGNFSLFKKKCGGYGRMDATDGAARPAFDAVLLHVHHKLGQLADGILDGDVTPRPYRLAGFSPCSWCEMGSVCRFELSLGRPRYLETMRRTRVLDLIQIETTGP